MAVGLAGSTNQVPGISPLLFYKSPQEIYNLLISWGWVFFFFFPVNDFLMGSRNWSKAVLLFISVRSGTFLTVLIILLFTVLKKKKGNRFSASDGRCRSCSVINLCEDVTPRWELLIIIPCDVRWPGAECKNLLLILTSKNQFQLDCVRKSMLRRPRKTTMFIQELVQSLQGAFDSSRCRCGYQLYAE